MKQGISPTAAIAIVAIVVIVVGAIGYFGFIKPKGDDSEVPEEEQDQMLQDAMKAGMKDKGRQMQQQGQAAPQ